MNRNMKKTIKTGIFVLIIIAIIIGIIVYQSVKNSNDDKNNNLNSLPALQYTEDEAQDFYTKKLIRFLNIFENDFHIKYKAITTSDDGTEKIRNEEFSKKGNDMAVYSMDDNERMVITKDYFYHINEENSLIYKFNNENNIDINMDVLFYSLEDINGAYVGNGNEELNSIKYYYEEYKMKKDNTILIKYYFDENTKIKYIKAYKDDLSVETLFEIETIENRTYDFMFNIGSDYKVVELDSEE